MTFTVLSSLIIPQNTSLVLGKHGNQRTTLWVVPGELPEDLWFLLSSRGIRAREILNHGFLHTVVVLPRHFLLLPSEILPNWTQANWTSKVLQPGPYLDLSLPVLIHTYCASPPQTDSYLSRPLCAFMVMQVQFFEDSLWVLLFAHGLCNWPHTLK